MVKRVDISLTKHERQEHRRLKDEAGVAIAFWKAVCETRGLDPKTTLLDPETHKMTALPKGHNKHWCWPWPLVCKDPPEKQLQYLNLDE